MKALGYLLITASFLAGSYFSVLDVELVNWSIVVPSLLVGLAGVAAVQIATRSKSKATDTVRTNIGKLEESLSRIVDNIDRLEAEKDTIDVYRFHHQIDDLFMSDLDTFVVNRETIGHAYGLQSYADVMTHFATAERYLNRCWSASTDGYIDEVKKYLTRSRDQFRQALEMLRQKSSTTGSRPR